MLMRRFMLLTALLFMSTPLMAAHHGSDHSNAMEGHSSIEVAQPWTRTTPPGAGAGGGFVTLTNHGAGDEALIKCSHDVLIGAEFDEKGSDDGAYDAHRADHQRQDHHQLLGRAGK